MTTQINRQRAFVDSRTGLLTQWAAELLQSIWRASGGADALDADELQRVSLAPAAPGGMRETETEGESIDPVPQPILNGNPLHQVFGSLKEMRSVVTTLDFPSVSTQSSEELMVTVSGAEVGDAVTIGPPSSAAADLSFFGYVSADDTVTVRAINATAGAVDPASDDYRVVVFKFFGEI